MRKNNKSITKKELITDGKKPRMQFEICEAYFSAKSSLNLHIASVHDKQKQYYCELCNTKFTQKGSLKAHIKSVHEGKKTFKCDICD
jgi:uncharacterized Zn-finger protein